MINAKTIHCQDYSEFSSNSCGFYANDCRRLGICQLPTLHMAKDLLEVFVMAQSSDFPELSVLKTLCNLPESCKGDFHD